MGLDLSSVALWVLHPDPEKPLLPPSPLLLVATSDAQLRFFTLAHLSRTTEGIVAPPLPLVDTPIPMAAMPGDIAVEASSERHASSVEEGEENFEPLPETTSTMEPLPGQRGLQSKDDAAAATPLPESDGVRINIIGASQLGPSSNTEWHQPM